VAEEGDNRWGSGGGGGGTTAALVPQGETGGIRFVQFALRPPFDNRLIFWRERSSESAAAYRLLRQRLIERDDPRIVLCTSAGRHEGKTTLATNLAMAYAELGKHRVLLLEASFRVAALGEVFGFLPPKGLAGQLAQHRSRPADPWVVVQIGNGPLFVMAAEPRACGSCAAVLAEEAKFCPMCGQKTGTGTHPVLDGVALSAAIRHFRQSFDYVILDAPPVLSGGEVNLIQDVADAIVFATRKGRSMGRTLRRAMEQVAPAPVAAVALIED
jgi:Mrp family chromosome partitioning ATPase